MQHSSGSEHVAPGAAQAPASAGRVGETQTFDAPKGHDVDTQQVVDLRRMLKGAGLAPA